MFSFGLSTYCEKEYHKNFIQENEKLHSKLTYRIKLVEPMFEEDFHENG